MRAISTRVTNPDLTEKGKAISRVRMVAAHFNGKSRVQIHREINQICAEEIAAGLHALAIDVKGTRIGVRTLPRLHF